MRIFKGAFFVSFSLVLIFTYANAKAEEKFSIQANVDKVRLAIGENLTFTVTISDGYKETPKLKVPEFKGLELISTRSCHRLNIKRGKSSSISQFDYLLRANSVGTFTIGACQLTYKGKLYKSEPIQILVIPASEKRPMRPSEPPQLPNRRPPKLKGGITL